MWCLSVALPVSGQRPVTDPSTPRHDKTMITSSVRGDIEVLAADGLRDRKGDFHSGDGLVALASMDQPMASEYPQPDSEPATTRAESSESRHPECLRR